ncbi:MAG TPA: type II toxin-antitoxin system mRNA interferase toxin, RelE/StbE family [Candidatus Saccharimonadales bacterium]|nr:type II toxin-antitoxin system mRNA interferase toxin, RelE/StbE family [Candidatus Saccharimonadales bacterium]
MNIDFTKQFNKQFEKLPRKLREQAKTTIALFLDDLAAPSLRNHALRGEWAGHRSISAGGDLRLHFKMIGEATVLFVAIGSHSQLYK